MGTPKQPKQQLLTDEDLKALESRFGDEPVTHWLNGEYWWDDRWWTAREAVQKMQEMTKKNA